MAAVLKPPCLFMKIYIQLLKGYAVGRLLVPSDLYYLPGDLLSLLYHIAPKMKLCHLENLAISRKACSEAASRFLWAFSLSIASSSVVTVRRMGKKASIP